MAKQKQYKAFDELVLEKMERETQAATIAHRVADQVCPKRVLRELGDSLLGRFGWQCVYGEALRAVTEIRGRQRRDVLQFDLENAGPAPARPNAPGKSPSRPTYTTGNMKPPTKPDVYDRSLIVDDVDRLVADFKIGDTPILEATIDQIIDAANRLQAQADGCLRYAGLYRDVAERARANGCEDTGTETAGAYLTSWEFAAMAQGHEIPEFMPKGSEAMAAAEA